jgi:hypothetical protein
LPAHQASMLKHALYRIAGLVGSIFADFGNN